MHIYGPAHLHGPQSISAPHAQRVAQPSTSAASSTQTDQLDLSDAARVAARMSEIPDIRQDRVAEIRAAIAQGTYETADKLEIALDRLLNEIA